MKVEVRLGGNLFKKEIGGRVHQLVGCIRLVDFGSLFMSTNKKEKSFINITEIIKQKLLTANKVTPITPEKKKEYNRIAYLNRNLLEFLNILSV